MKFMAYILSIYIFSLLTYPCQDAICNTHLCKIEKSTDHNKSHDEQKCHGCSPFCVCCCCHANTLTSIKTDLKIVGTTPILYIVEYNESFLKEINNAIWEPPKV